MEVCWLILENLTSGIISVDLKGNILYINPMAKKILHIINDITNKNYKEVFHNYSELENLIDEMLSLNKTIRRGEIEITHAVIKLKIGYSTMQIKNKDGILMGYNIIFQDLSLIADYDRK